MTRQPRHHRKHSGFTLIEVMIAMVLIAMMCLSVFVALRQITNTAMAVAVRNEAYHLMQQQAEQLLAGTYADFSTVAEQDITSAVKTSFAPSTTPALVLPADNASGRITFKRQVVSVASTATSKTLRVEVDWTWQGHANEISTLLFRAQ